MFILSVVAMVIVVYVWLYYFNNIILSFSEPQKSASETESGFGFWQTMKNGFTVIYEGFLGKLRWLAKAINEPREYIISPK